MGDMADYYGADGSGYIVDEEEEMPDIEETTETVTTSRIVLGQSDLMKMVRAYLPLLFKTVEEQDGVTLTIKQDEYDEPIEVDDDTMLTLVVVKKRSK